MILVTEHPIDVNALILQANGPENGALASFVGVVRGHSRQGRVKSLYYEAYVPMALKCFEKIAREAEEKWRVSHLSIVHRVGLLNVGEAAVAVVAASAHRREALAACSEAIERVKAEAPIWKKEFMENDEAVWVEDNCGTRFREASRV